MKYNHVTEHITSLSGVSLIAKGLKRNKRHSLHAADFLPLCLSILYFMFPSIQVVEPKLEAGGEV